MLLAMASPTRRLAQKAGRHSDRDDAALLRSIDAQGSR